MMEVPGHSLTGQRGEAFLHSHWGSKLRVQRLGSRYLSGRSPASRCAQSALALASAKTAWTCSAASGALVGLREPSGSALGTIWMVLLKDRCSAIGSFLRQRAKLPLHVLKAAEGQHTVLIFKKVSHWHAEVL